jgi:hypothetical protein
MGSRANFVVIRNGKAAAYYDQWAAMGCVYAFADGPDGAVAVLEPMEPCTELMDWAFAEGGYLLDFDEKRAIVFGLPGDDLDLEELEGVDPDELAQGSAVHEALLESPSAFLASVAPRWAGWLLRWDDAGVDAFSAHLERRGIDNISTQPKAHPDGTKAFFENQV